MLIYLPSVIFHNKSVLSGLAWSWMSCYWLHPSIRNASLRIMHFQLVNKNRFLKIRSLRHVAYTIFTVFCIRHAINSTGPALCPYGIKLQYEDLTNPPHQHKGNHTYLFLKQENPILSASINTLQWCLMLLILRCTVYTQRQKNGAQFRQVTLTLNKWAREES